MSGSVKLHPKDYYGEINILEAKRNRIPTNNNNNAKLKLMNKKTPYCKYSLLTHFICLISLPDCVRLDGWTALQQVFVLLTRERWRVEAVKKRVWRDWRPVLILLMIYKPPSHLQERQTEKFTVAYGHTGLLIFVSNKEQKESSSSRADGTTQKMEFKKKHVCMAIWEKCISETKTIVQSTEEEEFNCFPWWTVQGKIVNVVTLLKPPRDIYLFTSVPRGILVSSFFFFRNKTKYLK